MEFAQVWVSGGNVPTLGLWHGTLGRRMKGERDTRQGTGLSAWRRRFLWNAWSRTHPTEVLSWNIIDRLGEKRVRSVFWMFHVRQKCAKNTEETGSTFMNIISLILADAFLARACAGRTRRVTVVWLWRARGQRRLSKKLPRESLIAPPWCLPRPSSLLQPGAGKAGRQVCSSREHQVLRPARCHWHQCSGEPSVHNHTWTWCIIKYNRWPEIHLSKRWPAHEMISLMISAPLSEDK